MKSKIIISLILLLLLSSCGNSKNNNIELNNDNYPKRVVSKYDIDYSKVADKDVDKTIVVNTFEQSFNGVTIDRYMYTDLDNNFYAAGMPLIMKSGNSFNLSVINNTGTDTNIHWHGLSLANDQDGPHLIIDKNGGVYDYSFTPDYSGSYWYHSHNRPVRDQVDFGMHGPLVILNEDDEKYTLDRIMMLDDWLVNSMSGHMQVEGDVDTVNGVTGSEIEPIIINNSDLVKLRFIQASTAKNTTLNFPFPVTVTHTDGIALANPYETSVITFAPAERYDVQFQIDAKENEVFEIYNERDNGMVIPVYYSYDESIDKPELEHTKVFEKKDDLKSLITDVPDIEVIMDSTMKHGEGHLWTINGEVYPDAEEFNFDVNKEYLIRFKNNSRMFNHPMHIHGAHFKIISINGVAPNQVIWKDTQDVLGGQYVDVAIRFENVGDWMLHCHILDHEDGGMMTTIKVR